MKKVTANLLYFIAGILFTITAIIHFCTNQKSLGFFYICLIITVISMGLSHKKKNN